MSLCECGCGQVAPKAKNLKAYTKLGYSIAEYDNG